METEQTTMNQEIKELLDFVLEAGVEIIFFEPSNAMGQGNSDCC